METCPENKLILYCSRTFLDFKNAKQLKVLEQKKIDWEYLINTATQHGVMPLLYWNLNQICPQAIPPNVLAQLQDGFYANGAENLFLAGELLNLLKLLSV
ncbi:MAG: nucleotidyltransferase family protein [Microcystis aeruginosa LG13-03]|nr:nucleotidyltransferase family protein [Microcystis aeruginosa LG13-13]NCR06044.1 nucleotidyltransferase family protein [Microcystis aeruginosa LG13-03]NCR64302.1 nucleotidyltransferase family protein [Microcystis aeruginosa LG11-05]